MAYQSESRRSQPAFALKSFGAVHFAGIYPAASRRVFWQRRINILGGKTKREWLAVLSVDNMDHSLAAVKKGGGSVIDGPVDVRGRGNMAFIKDSLGAPLVLLRSEGGDPAEKDAAAGDWVWTDLVTP